MENTKDYDSFMEGVITPDSYYIKNECESLLNNSSFDDERKAEIERELWYYHEEELNELKANLLSNQLDRINAGLNYNQTDIKRKLNNEIY